MKHSETKQCTKCLQELELTNFYTKGNRIDSRCKECTKSIKKAKYVVREQALQLDSLFSFCELVSEIELSTLKNQIHKIDEVISKCQIQILQ